MKKITRLEQALRYWEDKALSYQIHALNRAAAGQAPLVPVAGPVKYALEFRRYLLGAMQHERFDTERFLADMGVINMRDPATYAGLAMGTTAIFPKLLWDWTRSYRRIFRIGRDLQALLNATTITNLTWADLPKPPFDCFAVQLETPLIDRSGKSYDYILVSFADKQIAATILPDALEGYEGLEPWVRDVITKRKMRPGRIGKLISAVTRTREFIAANPFLNMAIPGALLAAKANTPMAAIHSVIIEAMIGEPNEDYTDPLCDAAMRQIVGLCMYLSTISSESGSGLDWKPLVSAGYDPTTISNESEVCSIGAEHILTDEEREVFGGGDIDSPSYEVRTHGRRGHWRRRPYTAHDPTAKKTVWVKPVLVRADRCAPGTLPSGSTSVVR